MPSDTPGIQELLATAQLPSMPQVLLELLSLCDREDAGMTEIGAAVARDPAIAARIVSIANSPRYHPSRPLENLAQCLSVLGTSTVRRLALNQAVFELFGRFRNTARYDLRFFWFDALSVAVTARKLAARLGHANVEEAYLAGLLHDVGQLALLSVAAEQYAPLFSRAMGEHELMRQEHAAFGMNHAEVGAWLAARWHLHGLFVDSLLYHQESIERIREAHPLVQIIALANLFNALPQQGAAVDEKDLAHWQLDTEQVLTLKESVHEEVHAIATELGIDLPPPDDSREMPDAPLADLADAVSQRMQGMLAHPEAQASDTLEEARADLLGSARLLFGARDCALFLPRADRLRWQRPHTAHEGDVGRTEEITIAVSGSQSCIAQALQGRITLAGQNHATDSLADAHVLRMLGGDRLLCLPLAWEGKVLGILALGLELRVAQHFVRNQALLTTFAREACRRLDLADRQHQQAEAAREGASRHCELQARKLVHEANNPLGVVRNYLAVLRHQLSEKSQAREDIELIEGELRRVARILQQARQPQTWVESLPDSGATRVDVNSLVKDVIRFCRLGKKELDQVEVHFTPASTLPPVTTDPDKLKQVLTNLIFNAAEAMHGQGRIHLATARWQSGHDTSTLEISVEDNGPGLPEEILDRLYQPVPTSKGEHHSGLGLSMAAALIDGLGGTLQCNSTSSGTRFKIYLPLTVQAT